MLATTWRRFLTAVTIIFALLVALELIGFLLLPFGVPGLYCLFERCYP
jgi:hypothetical protein